MMKKDFNILNVLRGTSALFVLFYHFFYFFFAHQNVWTVYLQVNPLDFSFPFYVETLYDFPLDIGHLGVAYFFLISGFLIHHTLRQYGSLKPFLKHKVMRLWPSYLVCFVLGLLFVALFNELMYRPFPYTWDHILACLFWVRDILNYPFIDGAVWTLEIQLKFYLFAILVWSVWKNDFLEKACLIAVILSCVVYGIYHFAEGDEYSWFYLVILARKTLKFFMMILLGSCAYAYFKKEISAAKMLFLSFLLLACFSSPLFAYPHYNKTVSYLLGGVSFFFFIHVYAGRLTLEGQVGKFINWVSKISYPLYIGHVLPGYMIIYYIIDQGYNAYIGIALAVLYTFVMAVIVHRGVESKFRSQ